MATAYTATYNIGGMNRLYRGYITYSVSYPSDTQAKITISYGAQMYEAYLYGVATTLSVDGVNKGTVEGYLSSNPGRNWTTIKNGAYTHTVARGTEDKTVTLSIRAYGKTVNGIGSAGGSVSKSVNVKIAKKPYTYVGHGNPTVDFLSCDNFNPIQGTKSSIVACKSVEQGNAPFDKFELYWSLSRDGKYNLISSSKDGKFTYDFTQHKPDGGVLYLLLREYHKEPINNNEHFTELRFQIVINTPKITVYTQNGTPVKARIYTYNSDGKRVVGFPYCYGTSGELLNAY